MIDKIIARAQEINKRKKVRIVFLELQDKRVREAIRIIKNKKIAEVRVLEGKDIKIKLEKAKELLEKEKVDAIITGATHSSALTLLLSFNFLRKDVKRVSGAFLMVSPKGKAMLFADCAAQPDPTSEQLAEIALLSAETFRLLTQQEPKIALLSYSTKGSGKGTSPEKVQEAFEILKKKFSNLIVEGEIQADAALNKAVAKFKGAKALDYNVLIFPCLDAGNIGYKLVERLGNWHAVGPILQGLSKQVNDLSRGCSVQDIVALTAITVLQVNEQKDRS
ncbi:MAG: phosphate acyltransferase [Candidatus Pacearchaeota archaeon]|nr:phosphate acyltransferase [Candidatus Pacearchaeota archaeon]